MIDLHSHILHGLDDGPQSLDESLELVRVYIDAGFRRVVATPHAVPGTTWMLAIEDVRGKLTELNQAIAKEGLQFEVLPGMEIAFDPSIPDHLENGRLFTLAESSYVLIETPFQQLPLGWEQVFFTILTQGYHILMAHPERCAQLTVAPQLVDRLLESGVYFQITWDSFLGYQGRDALRMAQRLANSGHIHCLATDSHHPQQRHPGHVKPAAAKIEKIIGGENLQRIGSENPARVVRGAELVAMMKPYSRAGGKKQSKWRFW